jgi:propanediol dehydratase small subunit
MYAGLNYSLEQLHKSGSSPLDHIRGNRFTPQELRMQAQKFREMGRPWFAELLEDEADCVETQVSLGLKLVIA